MKFLISFIIVVLPLPILAGGLDLTLLYGSRYVGMGGQQVALVNDAYGPFYNPAGMILVEKASFALNSSTLLTQYDAPIGGNNQQRKSEVDIGPLFFAGGAYRLTDRVVVGLGVYPTALQGGTFSNVNYSDDIQSREYLTRLARIEIAPSVAIKVMDHVAVGLSYRIGYMQADNKNGLFAGTTGAFFDSTHSGWDAKGLKLAAFLYDVKRFNFALTYRFRMSTTLDGSTRRIFDTQQGVTPVEKVSTQTTVRIPAKLQAGLSYEFLPDRLIGAFTYEFTGNSVVKQSAVTSNPADSNLPGAPLSWRDGHTFHLGAEYVFNLAKNRHIRTQLGLAYDRAVTRPDKPNPVIAPPEAYIGYALGAQYELEHHIAGLAVNYGQYSKTVSNIDPNLAGAAFAGKYGLKSLMVVADYQYRF